MDNGWMDKLVDGRIMGGWMDESREWVWVTLNSLGKNNGR